MADPGYSHRQRAYLSRSHMATPAQVLQSTLRGSSGRPTVALVLTATIAPQSVPLAASYKPEERLSEYQTALRRWIKVSDRFDRILWVENSGDPSVAQVVTEFREAVVIDSFRGNELSAVHGKGYGEAVILEHVAESIDTHTNAEYIVKCTGRLFVRNIAQLIRCLDSRPDLVVKPTRDLRYADSRLFAVRRVALGSLLDGFKESVSDPEGVFFEHVLARQALRFAEQGKRVTTWPAPILYTGKSASTGRRYDSMASRLMWPVRLVLHRAHPARYT